MTNSYSPSNYDKYLCLRINALMWIIIFFLMRPYVVLILSVVNMKDRMGLINMVYSDRFTMAVGAVAGIPVAFVLYAWLKKNPDAPDRVRSMWKRGRMLLMLSAAMNALVPFVPLWLGMASRLTPLAWVQVGIALLIIPVIYMSGYIRNCFADFPVREY